MLTVDLVRARRTKDGRLVPAYLSGPAIERLLPVLARQVEILSGMVGATRDEVDEALDAEEVPARDRVAALGLRKVLEDRCTFEVAAGSDPEALRAEVFAAAAAAHRGLEVRDAFDRAAVIAQVAEKLGTTPEAIDAGLYADLRGAEKLQAFEPLAPSVAVERYNLGLAQAILLRATRVAVRLEGADARAYKRAFRAARFHQLLHVVRPLPEGGYLVELDGPFSLFDSVQRYGLKLALFLPTVLAFERWHVHADVLWGKERAPYGFEIGPEDGLVSSSPLPTDTAPELETFCAAFARLGSEWKVRESNKLFALPGEEVCAPDLVFESRDTGEQVFLEVFGFWSRAAVWRRVEQIRRGALRSRILLAVGKHLRVSEEVLGEEDSGELYVYKATLSPRAVLERLRRPSPPGPLSR